MAALLLIAIADRTINRFLVNSLREAQNLKDFLEQTGDYRQVGVYEVRKTEGTFTELRQLEQVTQ